MYIYIYILHMHTAYTHTYTHTHHTRAVHFIALYFISLHYTTLEYACWTFPNILTKTGRSLTIPHSIYLRIITWPAFPKVCSNILPQVAVHLGVFSPSRSKYDAVALACCCAQKLLTLGKNCENHWKTMENSGKSGRFAWGNGDRIYHSTIEFGVDWFGFVAASVRIENGFAFICICASWGK